VDLGYNLTSNPAIVRTYDYLDDVGDPSSVLFEKPVYLHQFQDNTVGSNTFYARLFNNSIVSLSSYEGFHLGYRQITENRGTGGGKTVHRFSIESGQTSGSFAPFTTNFFPIAPNEPRIISGKLENNQQFKDDGTLVASLQNIRQEDDYEFYPNLTTVQASVLGGMGCPTFTNINTYTLKSGIYRVGQRIQEMDGVRTTTDYGYHTTYPLTHTLAISEQMTNSDGQEFLTEYEYSPDQNTAISNELSNQNRLVLLESRKLVDGQLVDGSRTGYSFFSASTGLPATTGIGPYPHTFERYEMTFDNQGNRVITGADNGWEPTFEDFEWEYTYFNGTNLLSEMIDIDGQDTDYLYDQLSRVIEINERDGNVITEMDYQYVGNGNAYNFIEQTQNFTLESTGKSALKTVQTRTYADGLGRVSQINQVKHSPDASNPEDIINATTYDNQSRAFRIYEPFESSFGGGNFTPIPSATAYTETTYEASPLNRSIKVIPPQWHPTHRLYGKNESSITIPGTSILFGVGELSTNTIIEADGLGTLTGDRTTTYQDKRGRIILSEQSNESGSQKTQTFTVFDDKERIEQMIPPDAVATDAGLIFSYLYDGTDNLIEQKIPDAAKIETVYNQRDLPIATQHGNLRADGKWMVTEYDVYGRPIITGLNTTPTTVDEVWTKTFWDGQASANFAGFREAKIPTDLSSFTDLIANIAPPNPTTDPIGNGYFRWQHS